MKTTFVAALAIFLVTSAAAALSKPKPWRNIKRGDYGIYSHHLTEPSPRWARQGNWRMDLFEYSLHEPAMSFRITPAGQPILFVFEEAYEGPVTIPPCCQQHTVKPVPQRLLKAYSHSSRSCILKAVIFITVNDRLICADPEAEWTQDRIRHLNRN